MAKPTIGAIELMPTEIEIRAVIKLDQKDLFHDSDAAQKNGELAVALTESLLSRGAIRKRV
jgi:hypothetical protein